MKPLLEIINTDNEPNILGQSQFNFPNKLPAKVKNWLRLMETGELRNKTVLVLHTIKNTRKTDVSDLRNMLGMPHQTLTAIISVLMDNGLVAAIGNRKHGVNYYSILCFIENPEEQHKQINFRHKEKLKQWIERGLNDFGNDLSTLTTECLKREL